MVERIRGLLLVTALVATAWSLWWLRGALGTPPVHSWAAAEHWYATVGPARAVVASVRVVALCTAVWLALVAALEVVASAHPWTGARALADVVAPRSLQRFVHGLAGLSLTAGLALPAPSAGIPGAGIGVGGRAAAIVAVVDPAGGDGTATMHLLDPTVTAPPVTAPPVTAPPVTDEPTVVTVRPGDSFWSIAQAALQRGDAATPGDIEVARYWRRVIDQNRAALVDPATPDLIYAGQVFTLPAR